MIEWKRGGFLYNGMAFELLGGGRPAVGMDFSLFKGE